ncbi:hypothetical protein [Agitococcus lubricus]|uniref:Uncharacterized protein n=1 Tax=Agitococcus lubricus TaxID=1077255 RepID=A0A2T5J2M4_9GAMM|nr:hypothetical protein [Agitococcus lubricus]PTQ90768.1 hypothetical protein C8N29_102168 [Agitococcus lubricus]
MKKPIIGFGIGVITLTVLALAAQHWLGTDAKERPAFAQLAHENNSADMSGSLTANRMPSPNQVAPAPVSGTDSPLLPLANTQVDAATSMANALKNGDPRSPVIIHDTVQEAASPEELANPKLYAQYEARQNMKLYKGYVAAADTEIPRLQQDIAKAKAMGLKPEQIAEGEEKLRRIQQMRDQLLSEHPEITR